MVRIGGRAWLRWAVVGACLIVASGAAQAQTRGQRAPRPPAAKSPRPRIVATLGPRTGDTKTLREMMRSGMQLARINMSHNDARSVRAMVGKLREAEKAQGRRVPLLFDLPGGKARITKVAGGSFSIVDGQRYDLVTQPGTSTDHKQAGVGYAGLEKQVAVGDRVLLDDGKIALRITGIRGQRIVTKVERGGPMRSRMGLTLDGKELPFPAMTAQDRRKLEIAVANGADYIGVSFVQSAKNVLAVRRALDKLGAANVKLVAKIESYSGIAELASIMDHADIIMIARGDLSAAVGKEKLPAVQAQIAAMARARGKTFAVATGLMSNMLSESKPSAANRRDVKQTVAQEPGWLILNETAISPYPVETVRELSRSVDASR